MTSPLQPSCKVFASRFELEPRECIDIFHRWIQQKRTGELLIDVADYSHVRGGPGVMLVAHECYYAFDEADGKRGLLWRRRRSDAQPASDALRAAVRAAVRACQYLEEDVPGRVAFDGHELLLGFEDRLNAPNTADTLAALQPDLERLGSALYPGSTVTIELYGDPRACFRARLSASAPTTLASLASRV